MQLLNVIPRRGIRRKYSSRKYGSSTQLPNGYPVVSVGGLICRPDRAQQKIDF